MRYESIREVRRAPLQRSVTGWRRMKLASVMRVVSAF